MTASDLSGNPRRFIVFTVFYNARAYYPVLAILFLDLGLSLDQFVMLNLIWAATILLFEVPSGALADTVGRRNLLVTAAGLMVCEMLCLLLAPRGGGGWLLGVCVLNRILSGLSEACASGADEALAYDSLPEEERVGAWDQLLAASLRWRAVGFVVAMILGGMMYDPTMWNRFVPDGLRLTHAVAHRLPVVLVLGQALVCLWVALRMVEPPRGEVEDTGNACRRAFRLTLETARWVFTQPQTRVIVVIGLVIDSIVRNFATITSSYYRLIQLPEWSFGLIGATIGMIGWFVPGIAGRLNQRYGTLANLGIAAGIAMIGLALLVPAWAVWGMLPAMGLMTTLGYLGFTVSRALHIFADSSHRATVLSVKGMAFNLGFGLFSLGFSRLLASFPASSGDAALYSALRWQVPAYALGVVMLFAWAIRLKKRAA
ncbi:MAG: MFS transporter [Verrucomicrobiota bacterium]